MLPGLADVPRLHVVRSLSEIARRRCRSALLLVDDDGRFVPGLAPAPGEPDDPEAPSLLRAPVLQGGARVATVLAAAPADPGDAAYLAEIVEFLAEEIAAFLAEVAPAPAAERAAYDALIGRSPPMQALYRLLDRVADSEATVLISGENGTGKELVARALHVGSSRRHRRFVIQNCSAFNDNLLDSELFGHRRGAFTGAVADKQGLFEVADGGTFFLDEVGDMSPALQVKLLRVVQEGTFIPVGGVEPRHVDVRLVAATHRDLAALVAHGEFREDLFYRLNVVGVHLPPLRERREDIPLLVEHFLRKHARRPRRLSRACLDRLLAYPFPGNVRELENEIERLVVLSGESAVIPETLLSSRIVQRAVAPAGTPTLRLPDAVASLEKSMIAEALARNGDNRTRAALELGVSRRNLIRLVQKYGLGKKR